MDRDSSKVSSSIPDDEIRDPCFELMMHGEVDHAGIVDENGISSMNVDELCVHED